MKIIQQIIHLITAKYEKNFHTEIKSDQEKSFESKT
jgi:hypothetical protein